MDKQKPNHQPLKQIIIEGAVPKEDNAQNGWAVNLQKAYIAGLSMAYTGGGRGRPPSRTQSYHTLKSEAEEHRTWIFVKKLLF